MSSAVKTAFTTHGPHVDSVHTVVQADELAQRGSNTFHGTQKFQNSPHVGISSDVVMSVRTFLTFHQKIHVHIVELIDGHIIERRSIGCSLNESLRDVFSAVTQIKAHDHAHHRGAMLIDVAFTSVVPRDVDTGFLVHIGINTAANCIGRLAFCKDFIRIGQLFAGHPPRSAMNWVDFEHDFRGFLHDL